MTEQLKKIFHLYAQSIILLFCFTFSPGCLPPSAHYIFYYLLCFKVSYLVVIFVCFLLFLSSVQFSHSVVSNSLRPHGLQHTRPPWPLPTPRTYSNSCPSHQWCHPTISSSVVLFSSHLQSFPASGPFQMSWFFASGGQYWSFSFSTSPSNEYSGLISFRMDWLDLLAVQGTLKNLLQHHSSKASVLQHSAFSIVQLPRLYMTTVTLWP